MKNQIWQLSDYRSFLKSEKGNVRHWALKRCIELFGLDAKKEIASLINDPDESIAISAVAFAGDHKLKEYAFAILKRFRDSSENLASVSAIALGKLGCVDALSYFEDRLNDDGCGFNEFVGIVLALGELKTAESLKILMSIADEIDFGAMPVYIISAIYAAILMHNQHGASKKVIQDVLTALMLIRDTGEKGKILTSLIKHLINPDILDCIQNFDDYGEKDLGETIYEATALAELDPNETVITDAFMDALKKSSPYKFIRIINLSLPVKSLESLSEDDTLNFKQGNLLLLKAFEEADAIISKQPKEIKKLISFAAISAYLSILECDKFSLSDDYEELLELFQREAKFSLEFEEELIDRLAAMEEDMTEFCSTVIEDDPYSLSAIRAVCLLGRSGCESAIPVLARCLNYDRADFLFEAALDALKNIKNGRALNDLEPFFKNEDSSGIIGSLGVLEHYPTDETVDLILKYFESLWINYNEPLLGIIEDIASSRFIDPLGKELKQGEDYAESVYLTLCDLHNFKDSRLEDIRRREEERDEKRQGMRNYAYGASEAKIQDLIDEMISLELKCKRCKRSYHYKVGEVYIDPEEGSLDTARIEDRIECKNCGAIDEYEFTPMTELSLTGAMFRLFEFLDDGESIVDYAGPLRFYAAKASRADKVERTVKKKKIGRNEPCPCNSGKKYKKCCGK